MSFRERCEEHIAMLIHIQLKKSLICEPCTFENECYIQGMYIFFLTSKEELQQKSDELLLKPGTISW